MRSLDETLARRRRLALEAERGDDAPRSFDRLATEPSAIEASSRERLARAARRETEEGRRRVLSDMLDVLDDLDRALAAAPAASPIVEGVSLVRAKMLGKLEGHGVRRGDDAPGTAFDPARHAAVGTIEVAPEAAGHVVEVLTPAYFVDGELLRPASVIVGRAAYTLDHNR
ncbi:MAG: nucleotide exchange factor GrpE [Myxococcota bacterium]